ncbi:hypothetical protein CF327_g4888 [Tilletia walkeri]|uniref:Uncharacterized protein n=1 Tax=Tilletia walkeri TaxID=117179 RepID=A0A8X7N9Z0_9BASI|nr:hypothetical protein CF327_g4888 [Tilletia walkeri]KAE8268689.1 hypothetical protein A4X09_0g3656 [Tilletia walkeri]
MTTLFERGDVILARHRQHAQAHVADHSSPHPPSSFPSSSSSALRVRPIETGLQALDDRLRSILNESSSSSSTSQRTTSSKIAHRDSLPRILEIAGPTASGKTSFLVGCAVRERLARLMMAWEACRNGTNAGGNGKRKGKGRQSGNGRMSWEEWEEEVAKVTPLVMLIDTEGSCTPERLLAAARGMILSDPDLLELARSLPLDDEDSEQNDEEEAILPLIQAVLEGIQLCRPATRAQFLATILLIDPHLSNGLRKPTSTTSEQQHIPSSPAPGSTLTSTAHPSLSHSSLPPNTSLLLIDSLSAFLRAHPSTRPEREERAQILSALQHLTDRVRRYNQACVNQGKVDGVMGVVVSNQMGVKMGPQDGSLVNFEVGGGGGGKMAVLVPQVQVVASTGTSRRSGGSGASASQMPSSIKPGPGRADARGAGGEGEGFRSEDASSTLVGSGLNTSVLGDEVWRVVLFRVGGGGHRFVQLFQLPKSVEVGLANSRAQQQRGQLQPHPGDGHYEDARSSHPPSSGITHTEAVEPTSAWSSDTGQPAWKKWIHFIIDTQSGIPRDPQ